VIFYFGFAALREICLRFGGEGRSSHKNPSTFLSAENPKKAAGQIICINNNFKEPGEQQAQRQRNKNYKFVSFLSVERELSVFWPERICSREDWRNSLLTQCSNCETLSLAFPLFIIAQHMYKPWGHVRVPDDHT